MSSAKYSYDITYQPTEHIITQGLGTGNFLIPQRTSWTHQSVTTNHNRLTCVSLTRYFCPIPESLCPQKRLLVGAIETAPFVNLKQAELVKQSLRMSSPFKLFVLSAGKGFILVNETCRLDHFPPQSYRYHVSSGCDYGCWLQLRHDRIRF